MSIEPTIVINLIDDVYLMWDRLQSYAGENKYLGTPTLLQLLQARRSELLIGDLIANQEKDKIIKHYTISAWHPARLLSKILFGVDTLKCVYMSFPIAKPRSFIMDKGDTSLVKELNEILRRAVEYESHNKNLAFFCPLTIDEYPIVKAVERANGEDRVGDNLKFNTKSRWDVRRFYSEFVGDDDKEILLTDDSDIPEQILIPEEQIEQAKGFIVDDVAVRDYRLVRQSDYLAVFNPVLNGEDEISGGVYNEIELALSEVIPIHVLQDQKHDPKKIFEREFKKSSPSLGRSPSHDLIVLHSDLKKLLKAVSQ